MHRIRSERKTLIIIGDGNQAKVILNIAHLMHLKYNEYLVIDYNDLDKFIESSVKSDSFNFAIAVGFNHQRNEIFKKLNNTFLNGRFPNFIHPSVIISESVKLGFGNVLSANVYIGPFSQLGNFTIVNTGSIIEHDAELSDFSSIAPGCELGGNVRLGKRSTIGIGSTVIHNIEIGPDAVIGAKSLVLKNCPPLVVMYGSPARVVKDRLIDENYLYTEKKYS